MNCPRYEDCKGGAVVRRLARIGANSTILPGVEIGEGALVGAGSVVVHDVPAGAVVAGNPARVIKHGRRPRLPAGLVRAPVRCGRRILNRSRSTPASRAKRSSSASTSPSATVRRSRGEGAAYVHLWNVRRRHRATTVHSRGRSWRRAADGLCRVALAGGNGYGGPAGRRAGYAAAGSRRPATPEPEPEGMTLRDYLGVIWRRKWIILLVVVVATASAYFFSVAPDEAVRRRARRSSTSSSSTSPTRSPARRTRTPIELRPRDGAASATSWPGPDMQAARSTRCSRRRASTRPPASASTAAPQEQRAAARRPRRRSNVVVVTGDSASPKLAAAAANACTPRRSSTGTQERPEGPDRARRSTVIQDQLDQYKAEAPS